MAIESGWLIEGWDSKRNTFKAEWWGLGHGLEDGFGWTKDSLKALRFARSEDAQAYIDETGWTEAKPTEHQWVKAPESFQYSSELDDINGRLA